MKRTAALLAVLLAASLLGGCTFRPPRWTAPPKGPSLPPEASAAVAAELPGCPPDKVYADQFPKLIQASGCGKVVYLAKMPYLGKEEEGLRWQRAAPDFPLRPEDDLRSAEGLLAGARLRQPVLLAGKDPLITFEQAKTLHSWNPVAVVTCVLGVDGLLHACFVQSDEALVGEAVKKTLPAFKYQPATADGRAIPATFQVTIHVPVPRPNCAALADPLRETRCRRALDSPEGPAAAIEVEPEIWGLPLGH
jgi:hypothetical protein